MTDNTASIHIKTDGPENAKFVPDNLRIFVLTDGSYLAAQMVEAKNGTITVVYPMIIQMEVDYENDDEGDLIAYFFSPYLENLAHFDVPNPPTTMLVISGIISCSVPSAHVIRNYYSKLSVQYKVATGEEFFEEKTDYIH